MSMSYREPTGQMSPADAQQLSMYQCDDMHNQYPVSETVSNALFDELYGPGKDSSIFEEQSPQMPQVQQLSESVEAINNALQQHKGNFGFNGDQNINALRDQFGNTLTLPQQMQAQMPGQVPAQMPGQMPLQSAHRPQHPPLAQSFSMPAVGQPMTPQPNLGQAMNMGQPMTPQHNMGQAMSPQCSLPQSISAPQAHMRQAMTPQHSLPQPLTPQQPSTPQAFPNLPPHGSMLPVNSLMSRAMPQPPAYPLPSSEAAWPRSMPNAMNSHMNVPGMMSPAHQPTMKSGFSTASAQSGAFAQPWSTSETHLPESNQQNNNCMNYPVLRTSSVPTSESNTIRAPANRKESAPESCLSNLPTQKNKSSKENDSPTSPGKTRLSPFDNKIDYEGKSPLHMLFQMKKQYGIQDTPPADSANKLSQQPYWQKAVSKGSTLRTRSLPLQGYPTQAPGVVNLTHSLNPDARHQFAHMPFTTGLPENRIRKVPESPPETMAAKRIRNSNSYLDNDCVMEYRVESDTLPSSAWNASTGVIKPSSFGSTHNPFSQSNSLPGAAAKPYSFPVQPGAQSTPQQPADGGYRSWQQGSNPFQPGSYIGSTLPPSATPQVPQVPAAVPNVPKVKSEQNTQMSVDRDFRSELLYSMVTTNSSAYRSHPYYPLLRDLVVADRNFDDPTFPSQLIVDIPKDFTRLLANYRKQQDINQLPAELDDGAHVCMMDALQHAHSSILAKIDHQAMRSSMPPMTSQGMHSQLMSSRDGMMTSSREGMSHLSTMSGGDMKEAYQFPQVRAPMSQQQLQSMSGSCPSTPIKTLPSGPTRPPVPSSVASSAPGSRTPSAPASRGPSAPSSRVPSELSWSGGTPETVKAPSRAESVTGQPTSPPPVDLDDLLETLSNQTSDPPAADVTLTDFKPEVAEVEDTPSPATLAAVEAKVAQIDGWSSDEDDMNIAKPALAILKSWLKSNTDKPYPDDDEKADLVKRTGLNCELINQWLLNATSRLYDSLKNTPNLKP